MSSHRWSEFIAWGRPARRPWYDPGQMAHASAPIGMFDSGAGGLAVLAEVHRRLPGEDITYCADSAYFPYGPRRPDEVRARSSRVTRELVALGAKLVVVACNTATSAAIDHLRAEFDVSFVGMEPALKPAVSATLRGRVALLVTPGTARGDKLAALIDRYGIEVTVDTIEAPGLAELVEAGAIDGEEARTIVRRHLERLHVGGADVLALGCTHYAFLRGVIEEEAGEGVLVIEPSEAVARQVARMLDERGLRNPRTEGGRVRYLTSGDSSAFAETRRRLRCAGAVIPEDTDGD